MARPFRSAQEMRGVLDSVLEEVDRDEATGPLLRAAQVRARFEFSDLGLALNLASASDPSRCLSWDFAEQPPWRPRLRLVMTSEVANSYLQGKENLPVAIARGRIRCACEARAALLFLPAAKLIVPAYRRLIEERYPHLALV